MEITIKKSHLRIAVVSIFLLALILIVGFFVKDLNLTGNIVSGGVIEGEVGVLYIEGSDMVIISANPEDLIELIQAATNQDQERYTQVFSDGRAHVIPAAIKVGVLERNSELMKVQILEGEFGGVAGWVLSEWFVN